MALNLHASIGMRIRELRESRNIPRTTIAKLLNVTTGHYGNVERGLYKFSFERLVDVSNFFEVSLDYLILGTEINKDTANESLVYFFNMLSESERKFLFDICKFALSKKLNEDELRMLMNLIVFQVNNIILPNKK